MCAIGDLCLQYLLCSNQNTVNIAANSFIRRYSIHLLAVHNYVTHIILDSPSSQLIPPKEKLRHNGSPPPPPPPPHSPADIQIANSIRKQHLYQWIVIYYRCVYPRTLKMSSSKQICIRHAFNPYFRIQ